MSAATLTFAQPRYRKPVLISVLGHALLFVALSTTVVLIPQQAPPRLAIQATLVSPNEPVAAPQPDRAAQERQAAAEREAARAAEQREAQRQEARQQQAERQAAERAQAEQARAEQAAADARRAEQERQARAQQQQREAEQAAERERQAQAERAAAAQREREAAERARKAAEQREQARRQAELMAAMEAEEALAAARSSGELSQYMAMIQQRVERKWVQPASAVAGVECSVSVQQLPSGEVIRAEVTRCNGDDTVRRSVENAVYAASPLPLPANRMLFDRNLVFTFRPQVD